MTNCAETARDPTSSDLSTSLRSLRREFCGSGIANRCPVATRPGILAIPLPNALSFPAKPCSVWSTAVNEPRDRFP